MDELGFWIKLALWIAVGIGFWRAYIEIPTIRARSGRAARPT